MPNRTRLLSWLSVPLLVVSVMLLQPSPAAHGHHQQAGCTLIHTVAGGATRVFVCPRNTPPIPGAQPIFTFSDQTQLYVIVGAQPTATRTQPPATATRTQATATRPPATQPPATPTQATGNIAPYPSAPLCPTHNNRAYHGLWDASRGCHYDHHHGDNPHAVDDLFGADLYARMGAGSPTGLAEISYPWQTFSDAGLENDLKHAGYAWHVRRDIPCAGVPSPCITAFRTLVHQHSVLDAAVQYHSYVFEAVTSDGGYILYGGWADFGDLHVPEGNIVIDVPNNTDSNNPNTTAPGRHKQHSTNGTPQIIWYGASRQTMAHGPRGFITLSTTVHDAFVYTNAANPAVPGPYACWPAPGCQANATNHRPHLISINMVESFPFIFANGRANWTGYADRYGLLRNDGACTAPSVDCAPVVFRNLRQGYNYQTANSHTANSRHEHDIYFNGQSSGWSQPVP